MTYLGKNPVEVLLHLQIKQTLTVHLHMMQDSLQVVMELDRQTDHAMKSQEHLSMHADGCSLCRDEIRKINSHHCLFAC